MSDEQYYEDLADYYGRQLNDEADLYNNAIALLQEADLLSKSTDFNDIVDCADTLQIVEAQLDNITTFDVSNLRSRMKKIEERINLH